MSQRPQISFRAWGYLLLGALLLIGPWIWPLLVLHWWDWRKIFPPDPWIAVPLMVWLVALSLAGLALIVLAFRWRP